MIAVQDAKFVNAFDWAVVRLATYCPQGSTQARLLFGSVSLLTQDRPRPIGMKGIESHKVARGKAGKIFFRRTVLRASDAIQWYHSTGTEGIRTPIPTDPKEVEAKFDGTPVVAQDFEDDPRWPALGVPLEADLFANARDPGNPAPFRGPGAARIHRRFGDSSGFDAVTRDLASIAFLKRRLFVDLADYSEYLGGLSLVVPDPILRYVQHFLVSAQGSGQSESVVYRLVRRAGQDLNDLTLTVLERRANLLSRFQAVEVPSDGLVYVDSELPFDQTGYAISHAVHGVIAYQQPIPFIRSVRVNLGVAGRRIKVQVPENASKKSPDASYEFAEYGHVVPIKVGVERHDAVVKVSMAEYRRARRSSAKQHKQTWFESGQRREAMAFLQKQLSAATHRVLVADPYFGALQIPQFLQAVPRQDIDSVILTSRLAFEQEFVDPISSQVEDQVVGYQNATAEPKKIADFTRALAQLRERKMKSVTAWVLLGRVPPLHDRFLVIDNEVFFLGNSLNALGERASLVLSVPDGEPILIRLQAMQEEALAFEAYVDARNKPQASDEV